MYPSNPNPPVLAEIKGDLFALLKTGAYDGACITTNGMLRRNGNAIMGAGVAKACVQHIPNAERLLGPKIKQNGNITQVIAPYAGKPVFSFPTKNDWRDASDIELIKNSCRQLMALIERHGLQRVLLPKPGCANGGLNWSDVRAEIAPLLDERVMIVSK